MIDGISTELLERIQRKTGRGLFLTRKNAALGELLSERSPDLEWTVLSKQDVRGWSIPRTARFLRSESWAVVVVEDEAHEMRRRRDLYRGLALVARTRERWLLGSTDTRVEARRIPWHDGFGLFFGLIAEGAATIRGLLRARSLDRRLFAQALPVPIEREQPRVAVLRTSFWFGLRAGGAVSHALGVLDGMQALGLEPQVWAASPLPLDGRFQQTIIDPPQRPSIIEEASIAAYNKTFVDGVEDAVRAFGPSAVYHRHDAFSLAGLDLARRLGVPLVLEVNASEVWARGAWSRLHFRGLAESMERTVFTKADRLVLISEELLPVVKKFGGDEDRIVVNPNGVDTDRFHPADTGATTRTRLGVPDGAVVCGFLGTFSTWHGVVFLAEQVASLLESSPNLHFVFIGDGDLRSEVQILLEKAGVSKNCTFTGLLNSEAVPEHLGACDILLSPHMPFEDGSAFFGSPTKLFEYMAAGRAIVASRLGQIERVLEQGETGLLFDPGDGVGFREAVLRLAGDEPLRNELGRRARDVAVRKYTWKANVERAMQGLLRMPKADFHE